MIDTQTGYNDEVACECKPCRECKGEGSFYIEYGTDPFGRRYPVEKPFESPCTRCKGSGKDTDDCLLHDTSPVEDDALALLESEAAKGMEGFA